MLIRIVRMTFHPDKTDAFLEIFNESKSKIRAFPGCEQLELQKDAINENVFCTYSIWESQKALNNYRNSDLFKSVWPRTKALFIKDAIAFSNTLIDKVL